MPDTIIPATPTAPFEAVRLEGVTKRFGHVVAVDRLDLAVADGEFFSLLGPSGCGKTTTLRMIAGFEFPTEGSLLIHGVEMALQPPNRRPVNTVFQSYALFPHMTVAENVGFGLLMRKTPRGEIGEKVSRALDMVQLSHRADATPSQLSGGQQQRVALARALVNEPEVLLLDEPLGALDLKLRQAMQVELKDLQARVGITFIYVTHDQEEALTMSDRIGVMNEGRLLQVGTPQEIYEHPGSRFVADFIGEINLLPATVVDGGSVRLLGGLVVAGSGVGAPGEEVTVAIRPERFELYDPDEAIPDGLNRLPGTVIRRTYFGDVFYYDVDTPAGVIEAKEENRPGVELYEVGEQTVVTWDPEASTVVGG
ncbi:MAG: ABC transporter ATP-binding protein [Acidimicrobiia bacterium]|nr:MAG: ABC transporter ATP-binding protein [Acidimicrobiia bacterium]